MVSILETLQVAEATIVRMQKSHGPFASGQGTLDVIREKIQQLTSNLENEKMIRRDVGLPSCDVGSNNSSVSIGRFQFWFSYRTLIAFHTGESMYVRENVWGSTTGKHLNTIDGGSKEAKAKRLCSEVFETMYVQHVASYVD